jgi:hypothetical protein
MCKALLPDARVILSGWGAPGRGDGAPCSVHAAVWLRSHGGAARRSEQRTWSAARGHLQRAIVGGTQSSLVYGVRGTRTVEFILDRLPGAGWLIALQAERDA